MRRFGWLVLALVSVASVVGAVPAGEHRFSADGGYRFYNSSPASGISTAFPGVVECLATGSSGNAFAAGMARVRFFTFAVSGGTVIQAYPALGDTTAGYRLRAGVPRVFDFRGMHVDSVYVDLDAGASEVIVTW